ncbi:MAG: VWA domain-containing protein [Acidimicrobiia bacterium]|nr:VWA domain-containing protein [Actinomycetota bacterium]MBL6925127.1 VWA domain-containing protein [Acidimicrobiia bacterium]
MSDEPIVERLVQFGHELRGEGLPIGTGDVTMFCAAVAVLDPADIHDLYWSGRASLVTRRDHIRVYDRVFGRFFQSMHEAGRDEDGRSVSEAMETQAVLQVPTSEPRMGEASDDTEITLGLAASPVEVARDKSFSSCTPKELVTLRRIIARMRLSPPRRRSRRRCTDGERSQLDMRRMAREAMRMHNEAPRLLRVGRKLKIRPLLFVLDVSGSMSDHSRNLLQFAHASRRAAGRVEVFCFGTHLTRITPALDSLRLDDALAAAARCVSDWDGGTQIGESLRELVRQWGRRGMSRGSIVVICSDGHDRGDPAILAGAMNDLSRLSHRIVWINPHEGDNEDCQPGTLGMMVAARHVDAMVPGRTLRDLEAFATSLPGLR